MRVIACYYETNGTDVDLEFDIGNTATDKEILDKAFELAMEQTMILEHVEIYSKEID